MPLLSGIWPPAEGAILVGAIRVEAFQPLDDYYRSLENLLGEINSGPTAPHTEAILIPGEGSVKRRERSIENGLQVPDGFLEGYRDTGERPRCEASPGSSNMPTRSKSNRSRMCEFSTRRHISN